MEVEAGNQGNEIKTYALTSENLKKFEEQLKKSDNFHGRRKIPQRTAGDGKSEILSAASFGVELENKIKEENELEKPLVRKRRSFYRPERESERRNPEGRSQNESYSARPLSGKTIIYDDEDYRIPYEDPNYVINRPSRASRMSKQEILYEVSSVSSSTVSQVRIKKRKIGTRRTSEGSIATSTSADSDDGIFDDDDFISADSSDDSNDGKTTTVTKNVSPFYPSSVSSSSVSSIPTNPSRQESSLSESLPFGTAEERANVLPSGEKQPEPDDLTHSRPQSQTAKDGDPLKSAKEQSLIRPSSKNTNISSKSLTKRRSLSRGSLTNGDQISLKSLDARKTLSRGESSISPWSDRDTISVSRTSRKDSLITIDSRSRRGSYVTIRNWSRWSKYSEGGYSITNKVLPVKRHKPRRNSDESSEISLSSSDSESSRASSESTSGFHSVPNLHLAKKPPPLRLDDDNLSIDQTQVLSRMSHLSLEPRPKSTNVEINAMNYKSLKTRTQKENEAFDFKNRTKKIPKLRDRPKRPRKESTAGAVSSQRSRQSPKRRRRRKKGRGKSHFVMSEDDQSIISSSSYSASEHRKPASSATIETKSFPRAKSSVSMTTDSSSSRSSSSMSSRDRRRRRRRKNNQFQPLNVVDSGFVTDGSPSSRASIRPAETPFTPALRNRYPSQQSIDSEYSSYPSICGSSSSLSRSASNFSLSSHDSDGESTAVGPQVKELPPKPPVPPKPTLKKQANKPKPKTKPKPKKKPPEIQEKKEEKREERKEEIKKENKEEPRQEAREEIKKPSSPKGVKLPPLIGAPPNPPRRKSSPYYTSLSPSVEARMNALRNAVKIANLARKRKGKREWMYKKVVRVNHSMPSFEEAYRDHGMPRLIKLARPKESKAVWGTSFWPVRWGDQTMIFPLSKSATKFKGAPRLEQLAISKKDFRKDHPEMCGRDAFQYSCGRSSVILEVSPLAMRREASARVIELAKPKSTVQAFDEYKQRDNYIFSCGRSSPIWDVTEGAKATEERERTMSLAHPKKAHSHYQPEKPCIWPISSAARKASPSPRIEMLSRPKTRSEGLHREPTWVVPSSAMRTVASARVQELAKAKQTAEGYEPCKELDDPLPRSVLRASATDRIKSLSRPIIRETMDHVQFNPDAFKVSPAALKGRMPDRIAELAQPIARR